jgi:hypothetical protein
MRALCPRDTVQGAGIPPRGSHTWTATGIMGESMPTRARSAVPATVWSVAVVVVLLALLANWFFIPPRQSLAIVGTVHQIVPIVDAGYINLYGRDTD